MLILTVIIPTLAAFCSPSNSYAADLRSDLPALLIRSGPIIRIAGSQGYTGYKLMSWEDGTVIDARDAHWLSHMWGIDVRHPSVNETAKNNYPIQLGADWVGAYPVRVDLYNFGLCPPPVEASLYWLGGVIEGTAPLETTWSESKASNGGGITLNALNSTIDGVRMHNLHDPIVPLAGNNFTVRNCWISYTRDDAIENDGFAAGLIEDCLFDGTFVFYSARNTMANAGKQCEAPGGGSDSVVRIHRNLIALQKLPGSFQSSRVTDTRTPGGVRVRDLPGWGQFWKQSDRDARGHDRNPKIEIVGNIFYIPKPPAGMDKRYYDPMPHGCSKSEDNVVIWMGDGKFPFQHKGFKVLSGAEGQAYWDAAKSRWIDAHPQVARVTGDPGYDPSQHLNP